MLTKNRNGKIIECFTYLFQLNSVDDHRLEMMGFCWENGYHGVLSDDGEMALFCPPRYFSAHSMKLSMNVSCFSTSTIVQKWSENRTPKYSGGLNTNTLEYWTFWSSNFHWFVFGMVGHSYSSSPDHSKTEPFEIRTKCIFFGFPMVLDKMESLWKTKHH